MKKIIELNDNLIERLEALQEKFNVKSLAPIVDIVLTIGLAHFEDFAYGKIIQDLSTPMYIPYPVPQPLEQQPLPFIPWEPVWVNKEDGTIDYKWKYNNWEITCNQTGNVDVTYKQT